MIAGTKNWLLAWFLPLSLLLPRVSAQRSDFVFGSCPSDDRCGSFLLVIPRWNMCNVDTEEGICTALPRRLGRQGYICGECPLICDEGFVNEDGECVDIDECDTSPNPCGENTICVNDDGSFACQCEDGFEGTPPESDCQPFPYLRWLPPPQENTFNPTTGDLCVEMVNGKHDVSAVSIVLNEVPLAIAQITSNETMVCGKDLVFISGSNTFYVESNDTTSQTALFLEGSFNAGDNTVRIRLLDSMAQQYQGAASVTAKWVDDTNIRQTQTQDAGASGEISFFNLPIGTIVFTALGLDDTASGSAAVAVSGAATDETEDLVMSGFEAPSEVDNNDFAQGLDGWNIENGTTVATTVAHVEEVGPEYEDNSRRGPPPGPPYPPRGPSSNRDLKDANRVVTKQVLPPKSISQEQRELDIENQDLFLNTGGVFDASVSVTRTFDTDEGTVGILVRYRFQTDEFPVFFGSIYNDYFAITIRSLAGNGIETEANSMNGLGSSAFDSSGSTGWREAKLPINANGDTVQVDITVANVEDDYLQSTVYVDFVEELKQSLCIFSNVAEDVGNPGLTAGHAAILYADTSTNPDTIVTYGLWPDDHSNVVDNGAGTDIRTNLAGDNPGRYSYFYCEPISAKEKQTLDRLVVANVEWTCTNSCASFASETFYAVTGTDVDADDFLGIETPREIGESIRALNGGSNLPPDGLPFSLNRRRVLTTWEEDSSFASDFLSQCNYI